ncbi:UDP-N-acetylmuramate--alanine ligase [Porphyromonas gingivicanis]|uniref:UDP-N-acetylmuramate--L-alanine ligase n=1 Tax=Porphyromonas gingivicanis TaxID=266762 RepID=A0A0A2G9A7_9PORP|nr:UDP-N-acetylmuramate--L-alanine ligase [Porphyromonas gingivicanis]KGN99017.1 UDP-N-acetylmuramate--alanine ligase [Porphyromonas gingivicanis]
MITPNNYKKIYFIGIGGIGMSALARYFHSNGAEVKGYDLTPSPLTQTLEKEGIPIHYTDSPEFLSEWYPNSSEVLVVYTPAVPDDLGELVYCRTHNFRVVKRSEALGEAVYNQQLLAVAGTHGKTTTSSLLAHLMHNSHVGGNAFLGGIVANYSSNLLLDPQSDFVVVEADEYDRSFLHLSPHMAIVTSLDPDHLDIYETPEGYREGFAQFVARIKPNGALVYKKGIYPQLPQRAKGVRAFSYAMEQEADFYADNLQFKEGKLFFDWHCKADGLTLSSLELGVPIAINVENATAAMAVAYLNGVTAEELRESLSSFRGIHRRFERLVDTPRCVFIDDYAHHPEELRAAITSVRKLYPQESILGIFQPHLYSRTQDFYKEFAQSLSLLDEVILLPIYPAREEPLPGVTSELILQEISISSKSIIAREEVVTHLEQRSDLPRIILTLGAGNIDRIVPLLAQLLRTRR